jgi:hypothetical protein
MLVAGDQPRAGACEHAARPRMPARSSRRQAAPRIDGLDETRGQRQARMAVENDAQGRAIAETRQAAGQFRIVGQRRADADEDGVMLGAQHMALRTRHIAGDRHLSGGRAADHSIGGNRKLQSHLAAFLRGSNQVTGQDGRVSPASTPARPRCHRHAGCRSPCRRHARRDRSPPRRRVRRRPYQRFGTGRCAAMMGAGFKRDIGCRAAGTVARLGKRGGLGMRAAANRRDAAADNDRSVALVRDDQRSDGRIRPGAAEMAARIADAGRHETAVVVGYGFHRRESGANPSAAQPVRRLRAANCRRVRREDPGNPADRGSSCRPRRTAHRRRRPCPSAPP